VWSLAQIAQAMHTHRADVIVHGACEGPDAWADGLAWTALVTRVVWPLGGVAHVIRHTGGAPAWASRPIADVERYAYYSPLQRNEAMAQWAGDQQRAGHSAVALTLRCDWPLRDGERATQGTATARDRLVDALGAERVTDLVCPRELGPTIEGSDR
jgi:hypothetical protein